MRGKIKLSQGTEEGSTLKAMAALGVIILGGMIINRFVLGKRP